MNGRQFLDLAREVAAGATELHWRGSAIHAYYALLLECRDTQIRWGCATPQRHNVHATVRLRYRYTKEPDLRTIADILEDLSRLRNLASYDLATRTEFSSDQAATRAIQDVADALTLLDAIEADPARLATAIASIRP
jgi:hypothetical protein